MLQSRRSHRRQCNTVHALCMLDNYGYKHTFRICSNYCFSTATMVKRTRLHDTLHVPCLTCYTTDGACLPHGTKWIFKCTVRLWRVNQINNLNYKFNSLIDSISPRLSLHHFTGEYIVMRYKLFICHFFFFLLIHEILITNVELHSGLLHCIFAESSHSQERHIPVAGKRGKTFSAPSYIDTSSTYGGTYNKLYTTQKQSTILSQQQYSFKVP